jgi:hypothetical protein
MSLLLLPLMRKLSDQHRRAAGEALGAANTHSIAAE